MGVSLIMKMKKKLLGFVLVVMSCFVLTACSDEVSETNSEEYREELRDMDLTQYLELGDYSNIEVTTTLAKVLDEDVQAQMEYSFEAQAETIAVTDRAVENGDIANIDFAGYKDGVAFEGGTGTGFELEIGSGSFIPGFEEGLVGVMPGETVELPLTFPANYTSADLAGQDVIFEVTVNSISVMPEMTDEAVAALGNESYSNVAELETFARSLVQEKVDEYNYDLVIRLATQQVMNNSTFIEVPEFLIEQQKTIINNQIFETAKTYGMDVETYISIVYGSTLEELAIANVKERLVIQAIANEVGIDVTDEELDAELTLIAVNYGVTNEQILQYMGTDRAYYREYMYGMQVYNYLYENVTVKAAE